MQTDFRMITEAFQVAFIENWQLFDGLECRLSLPKKRGEGGSFFKIGEIVVSIQDSKIVYPRNLNTSEAEFYKFEAKMEATKEHLRFVTNAGDVLLTLRRDSNGFTCHCSSAVFKEILLAE